MAATQKVIRPLIRLPAIIFPGQAISFRICDAVTLNARQMHGGENSFSIARETISAAWRTHDGRITAFGPGARIGCELHVMYDDVLDALVPSPPDISHAYGGERVRLIRTICRQSNDPLTTRHDNPLPHALCEVAPLEDEELSPVRLERLEDEKERALELIERGVKQRHFSLEPSHHDEELGGANVCDVRCHPMHLLQAEKPDDAHALSLWLAARLPLSTTLRTSLLATLCPLRRLQDAVDAMRLLCDPERMHRHGHRYRVVAMHPATDGCVTMGGTHHSRFVVTEAPPQYAWTSDDSFPHG